MWLIFAVVIFALFLYAVVAVAVMTLARAQADEDTRRREGLGDLHGDSWPTSEDR